MLMNSFLLVLKGSLFVPGSQTERQRLFSNLFNIIQSNWGTQSDSDLYKKGHYFLASMVMLGRRAGTSDPLVRSFMHGNKILLPLKTKGLHFSV